MSEIFNYTDYQKYLKDIYEMRKRENPSFSFRSFAKRAGLRSPNYLKLVIDGARPLTFKHASAFKKGLGLSKKESEFLDKLILLKETASQKDKDQILDSMVKYREDGNKKRLTQEQYHILSKWYPLVIKELALTKDFSFDLDWLRKRLGNKVSAKEIKDTIDMLIDLGLVVKKDKKLIPTDKVMTTGDDDDFMAHAIVSHHREMMERAAEALTETPFDEREFGALVIAINKKDIPLVKEKIREFRSELNRIFSESKDPDEVCQFNVQFFRHTRNTKGLI